MTDERSGDDQPAEFDWRSPRWRDPDEGQGEAEREHRFRDARARPERGAIDRDESVGRHTKPEPPNDEPQ